ncbi:MAG: carboxypeptidase-like regulatory domain-containing protein [Planctomycetota bacterium]
MSKTSSVFAIVIVLGAVVATWFGLRDQGARHPPPTEGPTAGEFADAAAQVGLIGSSASGASQQLAEGAGVTLLARVVDDGGAPVAGVEVTVERPQPRRRDRDDAEHELLEVRAGVVQHNIPVATAVSDADGRFRVGGLEPETQYRCMLRPAPPWGWTDRTLRADRPGLHEATYVLERGAALRGRVVDERGEGLQATVIATRDPVDDDVYRTPAWTTAADGRFEVEALPAGTWSFTVSVAGQGRRTGQLVVLPHDGEVLLRFRYPDGPTLMGKVTDVSGRPVAGASILVRADGTRPEARGRWWALAQTDAKGGYRLEHLDPGLVQGITVEVEGFLTIGDAHRHLLLGATGVVEVDFELARGCTVRGRVVDAAGSPVAGAVVMLDQDMAFSNANGRPERRSTTSDGEGQYVFERLPPVGQARLRAYTSGAASGSDGTPLLLAGEARVLQQDLTLQAAPVLPGVAVDREGMPLEGVRVEATSYEVHWRKAAGLPPPSATTDAGGRFELKGMLEGETWSVDAKSERMRMEAPLSVRVPASPAALQEVRLVLLPAAKVAGRVSDPDGKPLASYHLWMKPTRQVPGAQGAVFTQTNDKGAFVFDQLAAGTYELPRGAFAGDLEGEAAQTFELDWGQAVEDVVVVRRPSLALSGSVLDAEGAPLAGVHVRYRAAAVDGQGSIDRFPMGTSTDESGRFHELVGPGRYSLWAEGGSPSTTSKPDATTSSFTACVFLASRCSARSSTIADDLYLAPR